MTAVSENDTSKNVLLSRALSRLGVLAVCGALLAAVAFIPFRSAAAISPLMYAAHLVGVLLIGGAGALLLLLRYLDNARQSLTKSKFDDLAALVHLPENHCEVTPTGITQIDALVQSTRQPMRDLFSLLRLLREEVAELQERYEILTTNIAASVLIHDAQGNLLFCSPYTEVLTGYSGEEIAAMEEDFFLAIADAEDRERYQRARHVSEMGEDMLVRYQVRHREGFRMWLETRMVPVIDENGEVSSIMSVSIDVTDSLNYQKQIEEQNRDLSDFAYMVSHDLKAPIFTIKGMASALMEDFADSIGADGNDLLNYIVEGADRLEQLVASIIEYSSLSSAQRGELTDVSLRDVVQHVLKDQGELIKTSGAEISVDEKLPAIEGVEVRLYQVFSNLIGNALKYRSKERTPTIRVRYRGKSDDAMVIDVVDNGLGIPAAKVGDIFRPYHRAHGKDIEGSGIGLACVKKIIDRMGGTVSVQSTEGEGSTFTLTFPNRQRTPQAIPESLVRAYQIQ